MWGSIISAAGSIVGGMMGSDSASSAADAQSQASAASIAEQRRQYDQARADNAPFRDTGVVANARLKQLLGLDTGYSGGDSGSLLRRFSVSDFVNDPVAQSGFAFGAKEGTDAINARALAGGNYDSGATLKALTRFGNDYGSTKAEGAYNRYNTDNTNIYNRLAGVSGAGQTATNAITTAGQNATNNISNSIEGAGNARAAGIVGGANAWGGAMGGVSGAVNNYQSNQLLQQLIKNRNNNFGWSTNYTDGYGPI